MTLSHLSFPDLIGESYPAPVRASIDSRPRFRGDKPPIRSGASFRGNDISSFVIPRLDRGISSSSCRGIHRFPSPFSRGQVPASAGTSPRSGRGQTPDQVGGRAFAGMTIIMLFSPVYLSYPICHSPA